MLPWSENYGPETTYKKLVPGTFVQEGKSESVYFVRESFDKSTLGSVLLLERFSPR